MATLQTIRNRAGLLVAIIIGLALVAFILGDMLNTGSKLMKPSQMRLAEINGENVQYPDFQKRVEEISEVYKMNMQTNQLDENAWNQIREQAWQEVLHKLIMSDVYSEIGVDVTSDELFDMIQGANPHRIIQQLFRNPKTGAFDKSFAISFLKSLQTNANPQQKAYWLYIEDQIKNERIQSKYYNLINKGLYATSNEVKNSLQEKNKRVNFQYVAVNYSTIADNTVNVSDKDLQAYFDEHKDEFKQEKSRKIDYITFEVKASEADDAAAKQWAGDIKADFAKAQDNEQFVNANADTHFEDTYLKETELPAELRLFAFNGVAGDVYGPYKDGESYKLAKIDGFKMLPDSVKASHILISPEKAGSVDKAKALADSIQKLLNNGANFEILARQYSADPGSAAKGGDLGWFGRHMMVKPFEDAAFNGDIDKVTVAYTQFGIHLVKPTKKGKEEKHVRLAYVDRKVSPSTQTYQGFYTQASKFASENQSYEAFKKAVADQKLNKKTASLSEADNQVVGLESSRPLIRAAFQGEVGDVLKNNEGSTIFEFGNNFVIAVLVGATEEGPAKFADVRPRVELAVRNEKKAEVLLGKAKEAISAGDMSAIASRLNGQVKEATGVNFTAYSVVDLGAEPAVIGAVTTIGKDKIAPIKGNNGVYVVKVTDITEGTDKDVAMEKTRLLQNYANRANYMAFPAYQKIAKIVDKRSKFY